MAKTISASTWSTLNQPPITIMPARLKRSDGRIEPRAGDTVYINTAGPFGTPAHVEGEVCQGPRAKGLRVRVTHSANIMGARASAKTYALSPQWTVMGDPEIKRRETARADALKAKETERVRVFQESERRSQESAQRSLAEGETVPSPESLKVGDILTTHFAGKPEKAEVRVIERDDTGRFCKGVRVRCSQCEALCINGVATHERGCRNTPLDDRWNTLQEDE